MRVSSEVLREQLGLIFRVWGMPAEFIEMTSRVMIDTDLHGFDSHGIGMLSVYNNWRKMGRIIFDAPITVVTDLPSLCLIDGGGGLGHPVGIQGMKIAITKAQETGLGMVSVRQSNHFGAAGYYARMALEHDLIGVAMTGTFDAMDSNGIVINASGYMDGQIVTWWLVINSETNFLDTCFLKVI